MPYFSLFLKVLMTETDLERLSESPLGEFRAGSTLAAPGSLSMVHSLYNRSDKVEIDGNRKQLFDKVHSGIDCEFVFYVRNHIVLFRKDHKVAST